MGGPVAAHSIPTTPPCRWAFARKTDQPVAARKSNRYSMAGRAKEGIAAHEPSRVREFDPADHGLNGRGTSCQRPVQALDAERVTLMR